MEDLGAHLHSQDASLRSVNPQRNVSILDYGCQDRGCPLQLSRDIKGESAGILGLMNKLTSTNIGHRIAHLAMEILQEDGLLAPGGRAPGSESLSAGGWINQYMWSLGIAIAGGTANIQRNVIAERGFGLPRDAAANRSK